MSYEEGNPVLIYTLLYFYFYLYINLFIYLTYLLIYLFDSFNFAASNSNYIASNGLIISEQWTGSVHDGTEVYYPSISLRVRERPRIPSVRILGLRVEIWHSLQNTTVEYVYRSPHMLTLLQDMWTGFRSWKQEDAFHYIHRIMRHMKRWNWRKLKKLVNMEPHTVQL